MPLSYVTALSQGDTHVMAAGSEGTIRVGDVLLEVDGLPTRNLDPLGVRPSDLSSLALCFVASLLLCFFGCLAG